MRVRTLALLVVIGALIAVAIVYRSWVFNQFDTANRWRTGFRPAETPNDAMEKFRDAIQQRKYSWAASYCTKDYADLLIKCDGPAAHLGAIIDKIRDYMEANKLQNDQCQALLFYIDPFPRRFKVQGVPKQINDREAVGAFVWEPLPNVSLDQFRGSVDAGMFYVNLVPADIGSGAPIKITKEGDAWKLNIVPTTANVENVRYFLDHWQAHESELGTFRTYMTNGRYDSPNSFQTELLDSMRKARP